MNSTDIIMLALATLLFFWILMVLIENFSVQVYVVWAMDDGEKNVSKFLGVRFTERGAKALIHRDQVKRWSDLERDKWKVEWRYDPILLEM